MDAVYWMLFGEIIIFILAYNISGKDLLSPSVISILLFIFATLGIIYNKDYWEVSYSFKTAGTVFWTLAMMLLAEMAVVNTSPKCKKIVREKYPLELNATEVVIPTRLNIMIVITLSVLVLYYVYAVFKSGAILGVSGLSSIGVTKYSEEVSDTVSKISFRIINIFYFIYAYITVNNVVLCKKKIRDNWVNILPLIIGFIIMFFSGSRKLLVQYPMALVLMYVVRKRDISGRKSISTKKLIKRILPICLIVLVIFYAMREISKSSTALANRTIIDYLTYYISSPLYLLDRYIQNPSAICATPEYFGQYTFLGFYNSIISWGFLDFEVPLNKFQVVSNKAYMAGNEFTWIQRPYEDFGFLGMLILTFFLFYIYNRVYYKKIVCRKNSRKRDITIILYSYFYFIVVLCFYCAYTITEVSLQSIGYAIILVVLYNIIICRKQWNKHL